METITTQSQLRAAILLLEQRQVVEGKVLKEQFRLAYNSLKPSNILMSAFKDLGTSDQLKDNVLNSTVGLGAGYVSKMIFQGIVGSPLKKLFGSALMFGIQNLVSKNPDIIKSVGARILKMFRNKSDSECESES